MVKDMNWAKKKIDATANQFLEDYELKSLRSLGKTDKDFSYQRPFYTS